MVNSQDRSFDIGHPAEDRGRSKRLWTGLLLAPVAWFVQLIFGFEVTNRTCPSTVTAPGTTPDWLTPLLTGVNVLALGLCLVAMLISWGNIKRTRKSPTGPKGTLGSGGSRTRFLAVWGLLTGIMFLLATGFNTASLFLVPICNS